METLRALLGPVNSRSYVSAALFLLLASVWCGQPAMSQTVSSRLAVKAAPGNLPPQPLNVPASFAGTSSATPRVSETLKNRPMDFTRNDGQSDARVKFAAPGQGYGLFPTPMEAITPLRMGVLPAAPPPCLAPIASITHWYQLDNALGSVTKDIIGTNNGTLVVPGSFLFVPGAVASGLSFASPGNKYVDLGAGFNNLTDFSISAWVYVNGSNTGDQRIFSKDNYTVASPRMAVAFKSSTASLGYSGAPSLVIVNGSNVDYIVGTTPLAPGWRHVAVTRTLSGALSVFHLYIDGIEQTGGQVMTSISAGTGSISNGVNAVLGAISPAVTLPDEYFKGILDEITFYQGVGLPDAAYYANEYATLGVGKCVYIADLSATVTANTPMPDNGTDVIYTVTVKNNGQNTATNPLGTLALDSNLAGAMIVPGSCVGPADVSCGGAGSNFSQSAPSLAVGATMSFQVKATVKSCVADMTDIVVYATASASTPDPDKSNNNASVTVHNCLVNPVSNDWFVLSGEAQSGSFTILSPCDAWQIIPYSPLPAWVTSLSPTAGVGVTTVNFSVAANPGPGTRQAILQVVRMADPTQIYFVTINQNVGGGPFTAGGKVTYKSLAVGAFPMMGIKLTFSVYSGLNCAPVNPAFTQADGTWTATGFTKGCYYKAVPSNPVVPTATFRLAFQYVYGATTNINFYQATP